MNPAAPDRRISIVVPCHNRAAYLDVFLRSLTWSAVPPTEFEVIVVDDGGADHVDMVADVWRTRGLDVRVLHLRRGGAPRNNAVARNAGIREARHPIVLQTDPDIVFVSDVLRQVRECLVPGAFCSCSGYYPLTREATLALAFGADGPSTYAGAYLARADGRPNQVLSPDGVGGLHGAFACAKADVERVGGYDESFEYWGWEDRELLVTLERDACLHRRYMPEAVVVHLWHALARGSTSREDLAGKGLWSRAGWEVQMQRACAEHPRSARPRRRVRPEGDGDAARPFDASAYGEWMYEEACVDGTELPLVYQLFFDAHRLEAAQLRACGYPDQARRMLRHALERPWESRSLDEGEYQHVEAALEDLARCEEELGHTDARDAGLRDLEQRAHGVPIAAAFRARRALRDGDLDLARAQSELLARGGWTADRTALAAEIALLSGDPQTAADVLNAACSQTVCADYFERLRLGSYGRLVERLVPGAAVCRREQRELDTERSEFLYSAAVRSIRGDLDIGGVLLLERFLREGGESEERLRAEGRTYAGDARRRMARRVTASGRAVLLAAIDRSFVIV
jgi:GT2 family glycosyltransferase